MAAAQLDASNVLKLIRIGHSCAALGDGAGKGQLDVRGAAPLRRVVTAISSRSQGLKRD